MSSWHLGQRPGADSRDLGLRTASWLHTCSNVELSTSNVSCHCWQPETQVWARLICTLGGPDPFWLKHHISFTAKYPSAFPARLCSNGAPLCPRKDVQPPQAKILPDTFILTTPTPNFTPPWTSQCFCSHSFRHSFYILFVSPAPFFHSSRSCTPGNWSLTLEVQKWIIPSLNIKEPSVGWRDR